MTLPRVRLGDALTIITFVVSLVFSYGPDALRMSLPSALTISAAAAGAVWLSGRRPVAGLVAVIALALGLPVIRSTFEVMDLVVVLVVFRAAMDTELRPWVLAAASLGALTVNDAWQRLAVEQSFMEPSVLYPLLLTALSVGLGLQSRQVKRQHAELVALRDADRQRAVSDERRRIARDLHDVAAHHLSALVVRNKLARRLDTVDALADAARFTAQTAADTLTSLRQVFHVLNTEDESPLAPSPGSPTSTRWWPGWRRPDCRSSAPPSTSRRRAARSESRSSASPRRRWPTCSATGGRAAAGSASGAPAARSS